MAGNFCDTLDRPDGAQDAPSIPADNSAPALRIAGVTPFTTIDFPGRLAAVFYLQGCPLRCHYCHNPEMQAVICPPPRPGHITNWDGFTAFLKKRAGMLDGIVLSGGEPLMHGALPDALQTVKAHGYDAAIHTAGSAPARLQKILPLIDWAGFDVKTAFDNYETVTAIPGSGIKARESLEMLIDSGKDYEVRTTADPDLIPPGTLLKMAKTIRDMGVTTFRLQESSMRLRDYTPATENELAAIFPDFAIRRDPLRMRA
jgi:pyruvate formate lyase activating enzyme